MHDESTLIGSHGGSGRGSAWSGGSAPLALTALTVVLGSFASRSGGHVEAPAPPSMSGIVKRTVSLRFSSYAAPMRQPPSAESQRIFAPGIFDGQVALVTGGGSGIGLAAAVELARLGARVAICGRTQARLDHGRDVIAEAAGSDRVHAAVCDIRQPDSVDAFVGSTLEHFGRIDILVNNAGGQFPAPAQAISPKGFAAVVNNNLLGTFNMTRAVALRALIPQKSGRVINIIANIYRGFPGMAHTGAARAGVENLTMTLAVEWSRYGILVNAIAPGLIESSGTKQYPPQLIEQAVRKVPLARAGTVEEVAACIIFLASPAAQYISGTTVRIDGCQSLYGETFPLPD